MNTRERLLELYSFHADHAEERLAQLYQPEVIIVDGKKNGTYIYKLQPHAVEWFEKVFYNKGSAIYTPGWSKYVYDLDSGTIHMTPERVGFMWIKPYPYRRK